MNSHQIEMDATLETPTATEKPTEPSKKIDWAQVARTMVQSTYFWPTLILAVGLTVVFWPLFVSLYPLWTSKDGYYTHGFLVPLISGYLVYRAWPKLKNIEIKPSTWAIVPIIPLYWFAYAARMAELNSVLSLTFIVTLVFSVAFIFGWRWTWKLLPAILFLIFALPMWSAIVNNYTNPLQLYSTSAAYKMLQIFYEPLKTNSTTIFVGHYWLDVGVPCSGLKLVIAITAFTCFFMLIGGLKWWANLVMVAAILPLCLFINGLRIAMIGAVGEAYGEQAGHTFHDYSGYITLIVCFFILFKLAKVLGWKD